MRPLVFPISLFVFYVVFLSCAENSVNNENGEIIQESINTESILIQDTIPAQVKKLLAVYLCCVVGYDEGYVLFRDSTRMIFDDGKIKNDSLLLNAPDIEDMFTYEYECSREDFESVPTGDPGRIRNEAFFAKIYGASKEEVMKNLTTITWCPNLVGKKIKVNKRNGVADKFKALSAELDQHPEYIEYITNIGGTFNYRKISGTNRLSTHAYGITVDINVSKSNYWQWDCRCKNEGGVKGYKNKIPYELVKIFEKHGFIWGGRWRHYDTMHFEYRPELL